MHRFHRWRDLLQAANTPADIHRVIADYVASIDPALLAVLPEECQAAVREDDLSSAAITLLHCEVKFGSSSQELADLLHEIAHTFAAASTRLVKAQPSPILPKA